MNDTFERFAALSASWDLRALHRDVGSALDELDEAERPYVAMQLSRALRMFLDSSAQAGSRVDVPDEGP